MSRSKNSGSIVQYTKDDGTIQMAVMKNADQVFEFTSRQSAKLELMNNDFTPLLKDGKPVIVVKQWSKIKRIGMYD